MTHTNHRQGTAESLRDCFVVLAMAARGINDGDAQGALQRFLQLARRHGPVNAGNMLAGNVYTLGGLERLGEDVRGSIVHAAFNDEDALVAFLCDLREADLGVSIVISGLMDQVRECCERADLHRHTIEYSLGVWGRTERLPEPEVLEITTMCGHGQIAFELVRHMVKEVARGGLSLDEAAVALAKPCVCGIFDPTRAKRLLQRMVLRAARPAVQQLIAVDPSRCDRCYACETACAEAHPANGGAAMCVVDASLGPAVSLHCQHCANAACLKVCPTGNIVRDAQLDVVYMKGNRCIGCKLCVSACPFGMIVWDRERGVAMKCNMCIERLREGRDPACVEGCPTGALSRPDAADFFRRRRELALQAILANADVEAERPVAGP